MNKSGYLIKAILSITIIQISHLKRNEGPRYVWNDRQREAEKVLGAHLCGILLVLSTFSSWNS
jgi:hypothetical protein